MPIVRWWEANSHFGSLSPKKFDAIEFSIDKNRGEKLLKMASFAQIPILGEVFHKLRTVCKSE